MSESSITSTETPNFNPQSFQMLQEWFDLRYKGTHEDTLINFNEWMRNWSKGVEFAITKMDEQGKKLWDDLQRVQICVIVHPELELAAKPHSLKKEPVATVFGDESTGRIHKVCYPAAKFSLSEIESRIPKILEKDAEGCKLCKRELPALPPHEEEAEYKIIEEEENPLAGYSYDDLEHEKYRLGSMSESEVITRIGRMTKPNKLSALLAALQLPEYKSKFSDTVRDLVKEKLGYTDDPEPERVEPKRIESVSTITAARKRRTKRVKVAIPGEEPELPEEPEEPKGLKEFDIVKILPRAGKRAGEMGVIEALSDDKVVVAFEAEDEYGDKISTFERSDIISADVSDETLKIEDIISLLIKKDDEFVEYHLTSFRKPSLKTQEYYVGKWKEEFNNEIWGQYIPIPNVVLQRLIELDHALIGELLVRWGMLEDVKDANYLTLRNILTGKEMPAVSLFKIFPLNGFLDEYFNKYEPNWKDYFETISENPVKSGFLSKEEADAWAEMLALENFKVYYNTEEGSWQVKYKSMDNPKRFGYGMIMRIPDEKVRGWYSRYPELIEDVFGNEDINKENWGYLPGGVYHVKDKNAKYILLAADVDLKSQWGIGPSSKHLYLVPRKQLASKQIEKIPEENPEGVTTPPEIAMIFNPEKGLYTIGDTYPVRDLMKKWGFWWYPREKIWVRRVKTIEYANNALRKMMEDFNIREIDTATWELKKKTFPMTFAEMWICQSCGQDMVIRTDAPIEDGDLRLVCKRCGSKNLMWNKAYKTDNDGYVVE